MAGAFVLGSVALAATVDARSLYSTGSVGLNLFQSAITD